MLKLGGLQELHQRRVRPAFFLSSGRRCGRCSRWCRHLLATGLVESNIIGSGPAERRRRWLDVVAEILLLVGVDQRRLRRLKRRMCSLDGHCGTARVMRFVLLETAI